MYHPATRVLAVLEMLQAHPILSAPAIAARLEVDPRTVRRYVTMLQDMGVPLEAVAGRHGGYRLRPSFKLPPLMFTEEEALALSLGLLTARRLGLAEAAPAVEGALAKLERVLPEAVRTRVQAVHGALAFTPPRRALPAADPGLLLTLGSAVQCERRVWLHYRALDGAESARSVDPWGLVHHAGRWYLVGWCHLRQDVRTFRLDRVARAGPLDERFLRPRDVDCAAVVLRSLASLPYGAAVEVLLRLSLEQARRRVAPDVAVLEETEDGVVLRTHADDLGWMARYLVGLGCDLAVRRPPELRQALRDLAAEVARLAEADARSGG